MSYKNTCLGEFTCGNTFNSYKANENLITENSIITLKKNIWNSTTEPKTEYTNSEFLWGTLHTKHTDWIYVIPDN